MQKKYKHRFQLFKGNPQAKCLEAQCESVCSNAKCIFRAKCHSISSENFSNAIVCSAGEKRKATEPMKIKANYLKLRNKSAAERHAAKAAAPAATSASTVQAAMDAVVVTGSIDVVQ